MQHSYERLRGNAREPDFPLHISTVAAEARAAAAELRARVVGRVEWLSGDELGDLAAEIGALYSDPSQIAALLTRLSASYPRPRA